MRLHLISEKYFCHYCKPHPNAPKKDLKFYKIKISQKNNTIT